MASFTMELNEVLELLHDPGFPDWKADTAGVTIGLQDYPIFSSAHPGMPDHRAVLNRKIIRRYWNREIGFETVSKFQLALERRMDEIMPFFNQLYETELIDYPALSTFGLTTTRNESSNSTSENKATSHVKNESESVSRSQSSETPQNELPDNWEENADYATSGAASQAKSDGSADTEGSNVGTGSNTGSGSSTTTGYQGAASDLIGKFRAQILNIDQAVLDRLNDLFMGIWGSGDELIPLPSQTVIPRRGIPNLNF
jgi:hypothetical protein